ncbi:hypothetical protein MKW98_000312 [Papaver atlanticum]|uniref:Uncharacterized protein n=1 Tax=Papaver atlanticum TaxID=357466 RepID=A0AAD4X5Q6_9MAGN|nr:hypothetical protein MKW98_000312 [Papaver atlanticum]
MRKPVKNPFEEDGVVRIKNCIDFGFELQTRVDKDGSANTGQDSTFQIAASWQANKNFLFKPFWYNHISTIPTVVCYGITPTWHMITLLLFAAVRDCRTATTGFGFGLRAEDRVFGRFP